GTMDDRDTVACLPLPMRREKTLQIDPGDPHRVAEAMHDEVASGDPSTDSAGTDAYVSPNLRNGEEPGGLIPTSIAKVGSRRCTHIGFRLWVTTVRSMAHDRPPLAFLFAAP